ncbi:ABC transporter permease [Paeniglutamicibacter sp. MACA_103]|uniref:ABC transporter permease n=1 Tax=Paeniglutamicibacter sp. MACA_103 TaxID=3377337 RepID=UPI0038965CD3
MPGLIRLALGQARRERVLLPLWILGIALLGFFTASAVSSQFGGESERTAIIAVAAANPAFLFVRGLPDGTSLGAVVFFQGYAFTAVLAGLMSTFLVIRHTRADEELGRAELIGSTPHRRATPLASTLLLGTAANLALAAAVAGGFIAAGLPLVGSVTAGAAVGAVGLFYVGLASTVAQVMPSGRSANGAAAGLVGAAYLLRGVGDALGTPGADLTRVTGHWISLLSPIGWGQRSRPFSAAEPAPLLVLAGIALVLAAAAMLIRHHRDLDASLLPERAGREHAGLGGASLLGLAWRLQRPTLVGWCVGAATLGGIAGGFGPVVADAVSGNDSLRALIGRLVPGSQVEIIDVFATALLGVVGILAAAAGIQTVLRLRVEETEGRAELLLSTARSRARWLGANAVLAAASAVAVAVVAGSAAAIGLSLSGAGSGDPGLMLLAALSHVPAAAVFISATVLVFAVVPGISIPAGWGMLAVGLVLGQFGELLGLPVWLQDLSPFRHSAAMPLEPFDPAGAWMMGAVALLGAGLAAFLIGKRDLSA